MTRQKHMEILQAIRWSIANDDFAEHLPCQTQRELEAIDSAIYDMSIIDDLKKERDAALDTAYAALKMRKERKDG